MSGAQLSPRGDLQAASGIPSLGAPGVIRTWTQWSTAQQWRRGFELGALAALFLLTAAFGRSFSKLGVGFPWLHPTEIVLVAVGASAVIGTPRSELVNCLRRTRVVVPLALLWAIGAIASFRGLGAWGFDRVLHDIGLIEYSVLIPLLGLVIRTRVEFALACAVVAAGGFLAIVSQALSLWTPAEWDLTASMGLIWPASGMCAALAVVWVLSRSAAGVALAPWQASLAVVGVLVIVLGSARSAWLALLVGIAVVLASSAAGRRLPAAGLAGSLLVAGVALSLLVADNRLPALPTPAGVAASLGANTPAPRAGGRGEAGAPSQGHQAGPAQTSAGAPSGQGGAPAASMPQTASGPVPLPSDHPASIYADPGMEARGARAYYAFGPAPLEVSRRTAASGEQSLRAPYSGDLRLLKTLSYVPLQAGADYQLTAWVYLPSTWDGGPVSLSTDATWAGADETTTTASTMETGRWTRLTSELTPTADDVIGGVHIRTAAAPSAGSSIFVDALSVRPTDPAALKPAEDVQGIGELTSSFRSSSDQVNAEWRLAFWEFLLGKTASAPILGAGFGTPSNFHWEDTAYDRRKGNARDPFDVTGPHNSFINVLYRTGVPGLLCVLAILGVALVGLVRVIRRTDREARAIAIWLLAGLAITTIVANFTVALEGPFMGIFFWGIVSLSLLAPSFIGGARGADRIDSDAL